MNHNQVRRAILQRALQGSVTTAQLRVEFDMILATAASHLRRLRDDGMIMESAIVGSNGQKCNVITNKGRSYLSETKRPAPKWDDKALRMCMGMR